jgi:hypothetical protein
MQSSDRNPMVDCVTAESEIDELPSRHHSMLSVHEIPN